MTVMTVKQIAALRLIISIERTAHAAEAIRTGRLNENSDTEIAMQVAAILDSWVRTDRILEEAIPGKTNPDEQVTVKLGEDRVHLLHTIVLAGNYTKVNPEATDDPETLDIVKSLFSERAGLLETLETKINPMQIFPKSMKAPLVFN